MLCKLFPNLFFFNWSIWWLQCCVSFWCTAKWFSYVYMYVCIYKIYIYASMFSRVRLFETMLNCRPARLLCPWNFPGKNTAVGYYFLFQGIFPTQRLNPCLLCLMRCRRILYCWTTGNFSYMCVYMYIYSFSYSFPLWFITRWLFYFVSFSISYYG